MKEGSENCQETGPLVSLPGQWQQLATVPTELQAMERPWPRAAHGDREAPPQWPQSAAAWRQQGLDSVLSWAPAAREYVE